MRDIKDLDNQIRFIEDLHSRYISALKDRNYSSFSDWVHLNASGKNPIENIKRLGILLRKEMIDLEKNLDRTYNQ